MGLISAGINAISQGVTNSANKDIASQTNETNRQIAREQNELNYKMFQEQNVWNREQWNLENEYNSPSAQMQRYLEAGINPLWAISGGNPGNAQQLKSADWTGAAGATAIPAQLQAPQINMDEVAALQSVINGYQGFQRLSMEKAANKASVAKTEAETDLIKSQTISQDFLNSINLDTYDAQVGSIITRYENLQKEGNLTDADIEKSKALKEQAIAATSKTEAETFDIIDNISRQWRMIDIAQQNANSQSSMASAANVQAQASYQNAQTADAALSHQIEKDTKEFELKSNDQILQIIDSTRSTWDRIIGNPGNFTDLNRNQNSVFNKALSSVQAGARVLYNRFYNNPTKTNFEAVQKMQKLIKNSVGNLQLPQPYLPLDANSSNASVLNPSVSWLQ